MAIKKIFQFFFFIITDMLDIVTRISWGRLMLFSVKSFRKVDTCTSQTENDVQIIPGNYVQVQMAKWWFKISQHGQKAHIACDHAIQVRFWCLMTLSISSMRYKKRTINSYIVTYQLTQRKIPLISTSLTEALTMGSVTSDWPKPTRTTQPPDFVA